MTNRTRRRPSACVKPMLIALSAFFLATSAGIGQDKAKPADGANAKPAADQKAVGPKVAPKQVAKPGEVGPPAPGQKKTVTVGNPPKPGADVPQPTVVLKPGEKPGIKFDVPAYDFGRVRSGPDVEHEFWFTNTGNGPLEILRVKPS